MKLLDTLDVFREARQKRACSVLFYAEDSEKYLFVRRSKDEDSHVGEWEMPGGKIEEGETWEDGVRRELREELGYRKPLTGALSKREWIRKSYDDLEYRAYLIKVSKEFKPILSEEHDLHKWVKWKHWPQPLRSELKKDLMVKKWTDKIDDLTEAQLLEWFKDIPLNS